MNKQSSLNVQGAGGGLVILTQAVSRVVSFCRAHRKTPVFFRTVSCAVLVAVFASSHVAGATVVRMETNLGIIDIELFESDAPKTVANFLRYAALGHYNGVMIHRSEPGFVIQGGGYKCCDFSNQFYSIPRGAPVPNEFDPSRSNVRKTIAMAKIDGNPDSATSEWFINLADNSGILDNKNGGFTVFGELLDPGMDVVDAIAGLDILEFNPPYNQLPVLDSYDPANGIQAADLVIVKRIPNVALMITNTGISVIFTTDADKEFEYVGSVNTGTAISLLQSFESPPNQSAHFNNGMLSMSISGGSGSAGYTATMRDGAAVRPTHYYAYGPTPDDPADHWYDFAYDGMTGAEIKNDRIILHFVDGERGDDDRTVNGSITHTGAQAVLTAVNDGSAQGGGCSIATNSSQTERGGDWVLVSMFMVMLAVVRRRAHRAQHQGDRNGEDTNIASP
jgi:cyclophilin family peptidyl-prolyl cis-trans isomerase